MKADTLWTVLGMPTRSLPYGLSEAGMPMGLQLISNSFSERTLLRTAQWCEQVLAFREVPPVCLV